MLPVLEEIKLKAEQCGRNPDDITLIAVTKYQSLESLKEIYQAGCRNFGESRLQEASAKIPLVPPDAEWHFIGTLQSKKVGKVISLFDLIHSVDSFELAKKISEIAKERDLKPRILLQVNTSGESSKHGLSAEGWEACLEKINTLEGIKVEGLMTMAPLMDDLGIIRRCFRRLYFLKEKWSREMREPGIFRQLSMGMSNDYLIAIEEGSTLLRIGTAIFGPHENVE